MTITVHSTDEIVQVNGVPARIWEGQTERGVKVQCMITRIAVHNSEDSSQFDAELKEQSVPLAATTRAFPLRMIL